MPPFRALILVLALAACYASAEAATSAAKGKAAVPASLRIDYALTLPPPGIREVSAEHMDGVAGQYIEAEGQAVLKDSERQVEAPWMRYEESADLASTRGKVVITQPHDRITGHDLRLKLSDQLGEMQDVHYELTPVNGGLPGRGQAKQLLFEGKDRYRFEKVTYSTCKAPAEGWQLTAEDLSLDYTNSEGKARQVRVEYQTVPILYLPSLNFSLDNNRKSGFLAPTYGISDTNGLELVAPWYWNIGPNRDATLVPRYLSRRGLQLGGEFRYLEPTYKGEVWADYLADSLTNQNRYQYSLRHQQQFSPQFSGNLLVQGVSDNAYYTDLSSHIQLTSQVQLPREGRIVYQGDGWNSGLLVQTFQTLDPNIRPYERLPHAYANVSNAHFNDGSLRFDGNAELTQFYHPLNQPQGTRINLYPSVSLPITPSYGYLTPKLGWRVTRYDLDHIAGTPYESQTRSLPVFSLDSGLYLERDWTLAGIDLLQTLEPRAYYLNIPHRDQTRIPLFDSGAQDISMAQMFSENQFSGIDRINDANQVTLGVTSRFLEAKTGIERLQLALAQRLYFRDQTVTLGNDELLRSASSSDILAALSGPISKDLRLNAGLRYDNARGSVAQSNVGGVYSIAPGKRINIDYRYIKGDTTTNTTPLRALDLSFQWPLQPQWYGVGRVNYDFASQRLTEGLLGFEYNPGCWSMRGVLQQLATTNLVSTRVFFIQLELTGLTQLGPNPLEVLKRNIQGYVKSDEIAE